MRLALGCIASSRSRTWASARDELLILISPSHVVPPSALRALALLPGLAGAVFLAYGVARWRRWRPRPHWRPARARVVGLVTLRGTTPDTAATEPLAYGVARYVYEYQVAGCTYQAYLEQVPARSRRAAGGPRPRRALRVGGTLDVRYDPAAAHVSVPVEHFEWAAQASLAAGGAALVVAAWLLWMAA